MTIVELLPMFFQILLLLLLIVFGIQLMRRLDRILKTLEPEKPDNSNKSWGVENYSTASVIATEMRHQKELLLKEQTPEARERIQLIDKFLNAAWLQYADHIARVFIQSDAGLSLEKILKGVFEIQYPHLNPAEMSGGIQMIQLTKAFVERTLEALKELGFVAEIDGRYQMTGQGHELFEKAYKERIELEDKLLALFSSRNSLASGLQDDRYIFIIQKDTDDASEVSGGSTCAFSTDDENIYLGECFHGEPITAGFRFVDIDIPSRSRIEHAYLEFVADGPYANSLSLSIHAEDRENPKTFSDTDQPANRPTISAFVSWQLSVRSAWHLGQIHSTPDISKLLQEIVNRPDWQQGNSLTVFIKGVQGENKGEHRRIVGFRRAKSSQEFDPPRLIVEFSNSLKS